MELLIVPVPLFSKDMAVEAYFFRYQRGNDFMPLNQAEKAFDGVMNSPLLETLNAVGTEAFTMGKPIFVPTNSMMLLVNLENQCHEDPSKVVFVLDMQVKPEEPYLSSIIRLKSLGFRFAAQKISNIEEYAPILLLCDYLFFNMKANEPQVMPIELRRDFPHLKVVATHIDNMEIFHRLIGVGYSMYEGRFFRTPLTKGQNAVSPLKINLIRLLNTVQDEGFEFTEISNIIQRDTALSISLMTMVNSPYLGVRQKIKTINHAVAMLGQSEVRKWAVTAVSRSLGADKPDEITKLSLLRAKFAENLAAKFNMMVHAQGLFLMGLFSVLDVVLEMPMDEALKMVQVADPIRNALVDHRGIYYPVLEFINCYENADWKVVSRLLIVNDLTPGDIYDAYINASLWYRDLIQEPVPEEDGGKAETAVSAEQ